MLLSDRTIMLLSLGISVAGIALLFLASQLIEPLNISTITGDMLGNSVSVNGTIARMSVRDGNIFITLSTNESAIGIVMFSNTARKQPYAYNLTQGANISAIGKVSQYRGELEIIADEVAVSG